MEEVWKDIPGYEGLYQASNLGRIKSLEHKTLQTNIYGKGGIGYSKHKEKILKGWVQNTGYLTVALKNKKYSVHRLIAQTFIDNPNKFPVINHIDGNKLNNKVSNLEWCTYKHNNDEAIKMGLIKLKFNSFENRIRAKKINQYDLQGNFIKSYECSTDAEKELKQKGIKVNSDNIRSVCNNRRKTAGGYIWRYANEC